MRELPLTISGSAAALGLLAAAAQAEPVTLSALQMDELTAGQAAATSVVTSTSPQGTVTATVSVSTYVSGPQGYIDACENAMSMSISSTSVTSTLTLSCGVCESTTTGSASPPG
jgi:hypothetical protein